MTLRLQDKKQIISHITDVAEKSLALVAADYSGLSVSQVEKLRQGGKQGGVYVKVVRNT